MGLIPFGLFSTFRRRPKLEESSIAPGLGVAMAIRLLQKRRAAASSCSVSFKNMSSITSGVGNKRRRQQQAKGGRDQPASVQATVIAHLEPLSLLTVLKFYNGMLVWLQLCNPQGVTLFSFVRLPPRVSRPLSGAPVYGLSLEHAERLHVVGCGFNGKLVRLLSLRVGHHFEPQRNWGACHKLMQSIVRRVTAGLVAAVRDKFAKEAEELCASGQCAAAVVALQRAICLGD